MILALQVLTPMCKYIPKSALAAVIIMAVLQTIDYRVVKKIWKVRSEYFAIYSFRYQIDFILLHCSWY